MSMMMYVGLFQYASSILWRTPKAGIIPIFPAAKPSANDWYFFGRFTQLAPTPSTALHSPAPCLLSVNPLRVNSSPSLVTLSRLYATRQKSGIWKFSATCKDSRLAKNGKTAHHFHWPVLLHQILSTFSVPSRLSPIRQLASIIILIIILHWSFSTWEFTTLSDFPNGDMFPGSTHGAAADRPLVRPPPRPVSFLDLLWSDGPNMHQFHPSSSSWGLGAPPNHLQ